MFEGVWCKLPSSLPRPASLHGRFLHFWSRAWSAFKSLKRYVFRHSMRPPRPPLESGALFGHKWYSRSGLAHLRSQTLGFCRADRVSNPQADKSNFLRPIYNILFWGSSRTIVNRPPKCEFHEFGGPFLRRNALRLERGSLFDHNLITTVKYE